MGGLMQPAVDMAVRKATKKAAAEAAAVALETGKNEGKETERLSSIRNIMETLHFTAQQAMDALKIPQEEQSKYAALI